MDKYTSILVSAESESRDPGFNAPRQLGVTTKMACCTIIVRLAQLLT